MRYHFHIDDDKFSEPISAEEAAGTYHEVDARCLRALAPGETYRDARGDEWSIAPVEPSADKRLERIATAAMQSLLVSPHTRQCESAEGIALNAVAVAQALIAELDAAE